MHVNQTIMKSKTVTRENIFIIDKASRQINKEELKYRIEEYGKIKYKTRQRWKVRKCRNGVL